MSGPLNRGPPKAWRSLKGKYRKFVAAHKRDEVERWYNEYASKGNQIAFRKLVKKIYEENPPDQANHCHSTSTFLVHVEEWIAPSEQPRVTRWLTTAPTADLQLFLSVFVSLPEVNTLLHHQTMKAKRDMEPLRMVRPPVIMSKKLPSRRFLDGNAPFARLPLPNTAASATKDQFKPHSRAMIDKYGCHSRTDGDNNRVTCNPMQTCLMRVIPCETQFAVTL
eukprot:NODE_4784_length_751_cov_152.411859_g4761_i0.p1 GENE.NODE_4784_length_751_cov_152.411859_g4761_i0~~NODE_4784_length_751_cov_152.411859_g4761_i0.p1  ORF type:complete len:222 (-),score=12.01 NODE_4784_length_751_cov_152.411859_g4761_i0:15-680(-)